MAANKKRKKRVTQPNVKPLNNCTLDDFKRVLAESNEHTVELLSETIVRTTPIYAGEGKQAKTGYESTKIKLKGWLLSVGAVVLFVSLALNVFWGINNHRFEQYRNGGQVALRASEKAFTQSPFTVSCDEIIDKWVVYDGEGIVLNSGAGYNRNEIIINPKDVVPLATGVPYTYYDVDELIVYVNTAKGAEGIVLIKKQIK